MVKSFLVLIEYMHIGRIIDWPPIIFLDKISFVGDSNYHDQDWLQSRNLIISSIYMDGNWLN